MNTDLAPLRLHGVDHTARPTWRLAETLHFYRDVLGLPLVHVISARGWGPATHPDFLHFFFDSGQGSTIAFFHYLGSQEPESVQDRASAPPRPDDHVADATHTAWLVQSEDELKGWKARLQTHGLEVSVETRHEVIESIYVRDPNGYFIEFTRKLRPLGAVDAEDGALTLEAAVQATEAARGRGSVLRSIDEVWAAKAVLLHQRHGAGADAPAAAELVGLYVPRVPEFAPLLQAAMAIPGCRVRPLLVHDLIESEEALVFERRALGLKPAVWYGLFTGGLRGRIEALDREHVRIVPALG